MKNEPKEETSVKRDKQKSVKEGKKEEGGGSNRGRKRKGEKEAGRGHWAGKEGAGEGEGGKEGPTPTLCLALT